jgi:hypothetical protein
VRRFPRWYGASPLHLLTLLTLSLDPYLWHWVAVTGALFLLSAAALALRLRTSRRGPGNGGAPPLTGPPNGAQGQGRPPGRAG